MIDTVRPAFAAMSPETEKEKHLLHLIGEALIDHKERLYGCHRTGFTAEVAWPIMESILGKLRPYLATSDGGESGVQVLPGEPTPEMIQAALDASIKLRQERGAEEVQPDSSGSLPSDMVRVVWRAMIERLPAPTMAETSPERVGRLSSLSAQRLSAGWTEVGYSEEREGDEGGWRWREAMLRVASFVRSFGSRTGDHAGHGFVEP